MESEKQDTRCLLLNFVFGSGCMHTQKLACTHTHTGEGEHTHLKKFSVRRYIQSITMRKAWSQEAASHISFEIMKYRLMLVFTLLSPLLSVLDSNQWKHVIHVLGSSIPKQHDLETHPQMRPEGPQVTAYTIKLTIQLTTSVRI